VQDTLSWEASGGTISDDGLFVAGMAHGTHKVVAKRKNGKKKGKMMADTAVIVITSDAPVEPAAIRISPRETILEPGERIEFTATVTGDDGDPIDAPVIWQATGGVVDGSGHYTAGPDAGQFRVVSETGTQLADTARVTISHTRNQPPNASFTYECSGLECYFDSSSSADGDGNIESFAWNFGDGGQASGAEARHTFPEPGTYTVTLTVVDDGDAANSHSVSVSLTGPPPPDGIPVQPGESIQAAVDANPAGSVFLIKSGTHRRQQVTPKDHMTFVGEHGTVLDGENVAEFAFGGYGIPGRNVTIRGLIIEKYAPRELHFGAILGDNAIDWVVENNEVRDNAGVGIRLGPGMRVSGNIAHGNWNLGIGGFFPHGVVIENNEIYGNGFAGRSGEHAGLKIVGGRDVVLRGNHSHDNTGRGLWLDTDIFDAVVEGNVVRENTTEGIWLEVVCGAVIRDNLSERNGLGAEAQSHWPDKAGIQVVNGTDVEIYRNTLSDNLNGIAVIAAKGYPTHECFPDLRNVHVHDNDVSMQSGMTGLVQNYGDKSYFTSRGNRFEGNTYHLGAEAQYFIWDDRRMNESEWSAAGQDKTGTFHR
jgi:PKD repeat protein